MSLNANAPVFYPSFIQNIKNEYDKHIEKFQKHQNRGDNEMSHIIQDEIYRKFIKDIECGKLNNIEAMQMISGLIAQKVIAHDKGRWYA